jgi:hypothetical protein
MNITGPTRIAPLAASPCGGAQRPHRGALRRAGLRPVAIGLVADAVLASSACAGPGMGLAEAMLEQNPSLPQCIAGDAPLPEPLAGDPDTTRLSADPVRLGGSVSSGGTQIEEKSVITDFPGPSWFSARGQSIVLLEYTIQSGATESWAPGYSLALLVYQRLYDGPTMATAICPLDLSIIENSRLADAMQRAGHQPLPEVVGRGQTLSGWVAFLIPRSVTAVTLREEIRFPGGSSGGDSALYRTPEQPQIQPLR